MKTEKNNRTFYILTTIISVIIVAALGSVFVNIGMEWFEDLTKPTQWIPSFVIPIVWSVIYLIFIVVLSMWIKKDNRLPKSTFWLLIINGVFNILWCLVFFTLKQTFLGNIIIVINALLALLLIFDISKNKPCYALITSIYPIWVCIASTLNTALWILN